MWVSVRVNIRVAAAASKLNYAESMLISFRGGAVSAQLATSLCIVGLLVSYLLCHLFFVVGRDVNPKHVPVLLVPALALAPAPVPVTLQHHNRYSPTP
jgi:Na+/H+-translocating membrane pyrophosphatase